MLDLNGIRLRNRLVTSASLLGYGASPHRLILYGLSPIAQWVPLERFGAVTTRTLSTQPREGHFTLREDWSLREYPELVRRYAGALRRVDAGWINAFGWCNIGIERYFDEYFPRTHHLNRIVSLGGFSAEEFRELVETVNRRAPVGRIAAVELNVSCHNVNFPFEDILDDVLGQAIPASRHPVIVKLSPDTDYIAAAKVAERNGAAAVTAINAVKALRLDPNTGEPLLRNRFGSLSGRAIKPIGLRVVAELRDAGVRLPIIATAGIRDFDDCREFLWAGADAVSLGSEAWLAPLWGYTLGPLRGVRIRHLINQIERAEGSLPLRRRAETPAIGQGGSLPPPAAPEPHPGHAQGGASRGERSSPRDNRAEARAEAAVLRGRFQLRSGGVSDYYIDKYQFGTRPALLRRVAEALAAELPEDTEYVAGTALGAVPLAVAVSLARGLPSVLVRPESRDHGPVRAVEGSLPRGARVALLEDVVTTGSAALDAVEALRTAGATVTRVIAVVDREAGGSAAFEAAGVPYRALLRSRDLGIGGAQ
jgi:dihydroorotate dehydrogenase (NAD+) catalytic subunit